MEKYKIFDNREFEARKNLDGLLTLIDFSRLKNIFESILRPSIKSEFNILEREDIYPENENSPSPAQAPTGSYDIKENRIYLNALEISNWPSEFKNVALVHVIAHEMTHGISRTECISNDSIVIKAGYSQTSVSSINGRRDFFRIFDESITEKIAKQVLKRYIELDDNREDLLKKIEKVRSIYDGYVIFLDKLISLISEKAGVSENIVWEGIVNGYVNGENLFDSELKENFEESFYEGIINDIAEIKNDNDAQKIIVKLERDYKGTIISRFIKNIHIKLKSL